MAANADPAVLAKLKQLRQEYQAYGTKIGELDIELNEHNLVINAIDKLEATRKCWRLVGGVLTERTVGEVLPAVKSNKEGIIDIMKQLRDEMNAKGKELNQFIIDNRLQVKDDEEQEESSKDKKEKPSGGVLV